MQRITSTPSNDGNQVFVSECLHFRKDVCRCGQEICAQRVVNDSQISKHDSGESGWLRSDEARKVLQVSTCDLAHLRHAGKIAFRNAGNAYLYSARYCEQFARRTDDDKAN